MRNHFTIAETASGFAACQAICNEEGGEETEDGGVKERST